ncbi:MAG: hypothetical protein LIO55_05295, partial [Oscillospiraceae bacterium]|nr:hypothetical protein [Oscillospiraceae bacterium]
GDGQISSAVLGHLETAATPTGADGGNFASAKGANAQKILCAVRAFAMHSRRKTAASRRTYTATPQYHTQKGTVFKTVPFMHQVFAFPCSCFYFSTMASPSRS